jgi:hypothetical protein
MNEQLPKTIAYLRVSTIDQDIEKNKADILRLANDKNLGRVHFIEEYLSHLKFRCFLQQPNKTLACILARMAEIP